ncbi:hypothetical protein JCM8097_004999 [Rhodosporidiobolus ruineniae]
MSSAVTARLVSFRDVINSGASPDDFASFFAPSSASDSPPCCIEHGPTGHAGLPFLGRPFTGQDGIRDYYKLITSVLAGKGSRFDEKDLLVRLDGEADGAEKATAVWTGEARWSVQKTGKEWDEAVVWKFKLRKEGEEWMLEKWEVWADTLSAYLASKP